MRRMTSIGLTVSMQSMCGVMLGDATQGLGPQIWLGGPIAQIYFPKLVHGLARI